MTAETGTYRWMAPEVTEHKQYDEKVDVFSFAVLLWEVASGGAVPYAGLTPLQAAIGVMQRGLRPAGHAHPPLAPIMEACWAADPTSRPAFSVLVQQLEALLAAPEDHVAAEGGVGASKPASSPLSHRVMRMLRRLRLGRCASGRSEQQ